MAAQGLGVSGQVVVVSVQADWWMDCQPSAETCNPVTHPHPAAGRPPPPPRCADVERPGPRSADERSGSSQRLSMVRCAAYWRRCVLHVQKLKLTGEQGGRHPLRSLFGCAGCWFACGGTSTTLSSLARSYDWRATSRRGRVVLVAAWWYWLVSEWWVVTDDVPSHVLATDGSPCSWNREKNSAVKKMNQYMRYS
jgi:hypothetical protein